VKAAGGLEALAGNPDAIRNMIRLLRQNLANMPTRPVPRAFNLLRTMPEGVLVALFRGFLRSQAAAPLGTTDPASTAELDRMAEQMRANVGSR
jgi:2-dehydropantoate 2-reductase